MIGKQATTRVSEMFEPMADIPITWVSAAVSAADRKASEAVANGDRSIFGNALPEFWSVRFVSPPRRVHHKFYNVICNPLLWFLLHRSWSPTFTPNIGDKEHDAWNRGYCAVNEAFAKEISEVAGDGSLTLVSRDYQLMLVPGFVRDELPDSVIHHSFETPWPCPSEFELLPATWRAELLESLMSADVLSFPSVVEIKAFIACAQAHTSELDTVRDGLVYRGHITHLSVSAPPVRAKQFKTLVEFPTTQRFVEGLTDSETRHTFVTVDRAEPHKNIVRSINAFGVLLKQQPELASKVRFLLFLTPGPAHVSAYKRLSDEIRRSARRINQNFSDSNPVMSMKIAISIGRLLH